MDKSDLEDERIISKEEGEELANCFGLRHFETSAKQNINITETMNFLLETIIDRMEKYSQLTGAPVGQKKRKDNANINDSLTTKEQTIIKLDSNRLISSRRSASKTKRSLNSSVSNNDPNNSSVISEYLPDCCT